MTAHRLLPLVLCGVAPVAVALGGDDHDQPISDEAIVVLQPGATIEDFNANYGTTLLAAVPEHHLYLVHVTDATEDLEDLVEGDPSVLSVEDHYTGRDVNPGTQSIFFFSDHDAYVNQPALDTINALPANTLVLGLGVVVAVIDSGVDAAHPELAGAVLGPGFNFIDGNDDTADEGDGLDSDGDGVIDEMAGHGTLVAGLLHLIAPKAQVLPLKILDSDGLTTTFRLIQAIYYAVDHGADVINISLGSTWDTDALETAVEYAGSSGALVVAAAGNEGVDQPERYPAAYSEDGVFGVAALGEADIVAPWSNFGPHISISAPGVDLSSTIPDGEYGAASGTSFAAPLVAGTLALLRSSCPQATTQSIADALSATAVFIDDLNPGYEGLLGAGRLDAAAAVAMAACLLGDLDGDGVIGTSDLLQLLASWGPCPTQPLPCDADLNGDGAVDAPDMLILVANWG